MFVSHSCQSVFTANLLLHSLSTHIIILFFCILFLHPVIENLQMQEYNFIKCD